MMSDKKLGSWRKLVKKSPYLAGHDVKIDEINQTHIILEISNVRFTESQGLKDNGFFLMLDFSTIDPTTNKVYKSMLLNTVNSEILEELAGNEEPTSWTGMLIELTTLKGKWFGKVQNALRITRRRVVKTLPIFDEESERGLIIIEKIKSGETTWELIKKYYIISDELIKKYQ